VKADPIAHGPGSRRFRRALAAVGALYLAGIWLEAAGAPLHAVVPRPLHYFLQVAKLFTNAVPIAAEYRAEAYSCSDHVWRELDVRPFFPIRADDKESRFDRAMFFYRRQPAVMAALDEYLVTANNRVSAPVGGVFLMSLRIPIPAPGEATEPYRRRPLSDYGADLRKYWYRTPTPLRQARCGQIAPGQSGAAGPGTADEEESRGSAGP